MGCIRPATPGFLVTLTATILLAIVSFCVPYFKSVYFLKASIKEGNNSGSITFGTLGYCLELNGNTTCSKPSIGYELDINDLVGNDFPIDIPTVVVKWITYALVLHIVALALAAGSAVFGLLAHVREMSMACCSTCISGFAAGVALLAFVFDIVLFFLAKARIDAVGSAEMGNAIWLTLAAWIMLFLSGCFFTMGRCCINKRGPRDKWNKKNDQESQPNFSEQLRLDAVKAEADRKARAKIQEGGLPAFHEHQPLTGHIDGNDVYVDDPSDHHKPAAVGQGATGYPAGGYVQAPAGSRAVDEYYTPSQQHNNYPPPARPNRQASEHSYAPSSYAQSTYSYHAPQQTTSPPPMPNTQYLTAGTQHPGQQYGHTAGGTTYHSAVSHHQQPTTATNYDPYENNPYRSQSPPRQVHATGYNDPYVPHTVASPPMLAPPTTVSSAAGSGGYYSTPDRSYTLGGDGYGGNSLPPLPETNPYDTQTMNPYDGAETSNPYTGGVGGINPGPSQLSMDFANPHAPSATPVSPTSPRGPRAHRNSIPQPQYEDSPPQYDPGDGQVQGAWGKR